MTNMYVIIIYECNDLYNFKLSVDLLDTRCHMIIISSNTNTQ